MVKNVWRRFLSLIGIRDFMEAVEHITASPSKQYRNLAGPYVPPIPRATMIPPCQAYDQLEGGISVNFVRIPKKDNLGCRSIFEDWEVTQDLAEPLDSNDVHSVRSHI